ncbi:MAG: hypothetical protein SVR94_01035 [Pseudomonadota bacterium]|nr:hypothetical protein [Pseudomonadota bacterium]
MLPQLEFIFKWVGGLLTAVALYWLTEGIRNTYFSTPKVNSLQQQHLPAGYQPNNPTAIKLRDHSPTFTRRGLGGV